MKPGSAKDYRRRLPIYLLLSTSETMAGAPIQAVNQGVNLLYNELMNDPSAIETVYMSVITFDSQARQVVPLTELTSFTPPMLNAGGERAMGAALRLLGESLDRDIMPNTPDRKGDYKPLVFLMTDGQPTDNWEREADAIKNRAQRKIATIIALGCGGGVKESTLKRIADVVLLMENVTPDMITQYFKWVSQSVTPDSAAEGGENGQAPSFQGKKMITLPPDQTMEPFGKINLWHESDGSTRVRAYILMERAVEGAQTGIAIDGSGTMMRWFGVQRRGAPNVVSPFVQQMCAYLARTLDVAGETTAIYWATGATGQDIEEIGRLTAEQAKQYQFDGPRIYGNHTHLLPAVQYFMQHFSSASWGMYVFITDGRLDDLAAVKQYTTQLAQEIASGRRNDLKLVIIGVGDKIDEAQLIELDDLDTGTDVDLWDHKIASDMKDVAEIFTEVVDETIIVAKRGLIRDSLGNVVKDYRDTGVPALLTFTLPTGATSFVLEIGDQAVTQDIA